MPDPYASQVTLEKPDPDAIELLLSLFNKSVLKKAKYRQICQLLGPVQMNGHYLDIGGDNGVICYLLRQQGGTWSSADLSKNTVRAIRMMVGERVDEINGRTSPYAENQFDAVVIIDFLEHINDDRQFVREIHRVLKPNGQLIVNVPHEKNFSLIRKIRLAVGLTDEKHGHVRPGYSLQKLAGVLAPQFRIGQSKTYSGFFIETFDVLQSLVFELMNRGQHTEKGNIVTHTDLNKHRRKFKIYALIYPFAWICAQFDRLFPWWQGHSLIVRAVPKRDI